MLNLIIPICRNVPSVEKPQMKSIRLRFWIMHWHFCIEGQLKFEGCIFLRMIPSPGIFVKCRQTLIYWALSVNWAENFVMRYPSSRSLSLCIQWTHLIFFLILFFGYPYCKKVTFDNYIYDAISIGLISDWTKVSCSQAGF